MYVVSIVCIIGGQRCIFYLLYQNGECSMGRRWMLFVTITPLHQSMEGISNGQVCSVVLVAHLVLSVLLHLSYVFRHVCVLWCLERTWCCQCLLHLAYVCWLYVCVVGLGAHLVLSVLAALRICVVYVVHNSIEFQKL